MCDLTRKNRRSDRKIHITMNVRVVYVNIWCTNWMWIHKWDTYWFGLLCRTYVFRDILAGVPGCLAITSLGLMGRFWAWGLAPSWPEQGQDSFSLTLLINGTLIQGSITLCCSLCSHAQPLFHTQCMSPALGRTVSDAILLIQCLMIVLALVLCGCILSALRFCLQSAAVMRYVLISTPSLSSSLPTHLSLTHMVPFSLSLYLL